MSGTPEAIHGNKAKAAKSKKTPEFISNTVTMSNSKKGGIPVVSGENVEYAKKFVEENKK